MTLHYWCCQHIALECVWRVRNLFTAFQEAILGMSEVPWFRGLLAWFLRLFLTIHILTVGRWRQYHQPQHLHHYSTSNITPSSCWCGKSCIDISQCHYHSMPLIYYFCAFVCNLWILVHQTLACTRTTYHSTQSICFRKIVIGCDQYINLTNIVTQKKITTCGNIPHACDLRPLF
jgi:hypothetical protein